MNVVVGVDPGSRGTGLAVIDTDRPYITLGKRITPRLLASTTVRRPTDEPVTQPDPTYLAAVLAQIRHFRDEYALDLIAVEGITEPNPHLGLTNVGHILAAAMVYGAIVSRSYGVPLLVIRPGGHGSKPLGWYPDALVSAAERRNAHSRAGAGPLEGWRTRPAGSGALKDQRSAYDVAVAGHAARRLAPTHTYV